MKIRRKLGGEKSGHKNFKMEMLCKGISIPWLMKKGTSRSNLWIRCK